LQRSFEDFGGIDGKVIGMMGDLKRGRTVRSLCYLMKNYKNVRLVFIAPERFAMEPDVKAYLDQHKIPYTETSRLEDALPTLDAIYVTRMQTEWDTAGESRNIDLSQFSIGAQQLTRLKRDAIIMHPLPRGAEIDPTVDQDPRAMYWRQERNGMWMRVAVLIKIFSAEDRIAEIAS
jgi:aspartate carbamoyltransferase catalytic subunit